MLVVENGVVSWPLGPLATAEQADAYATARGWADWAAADARKAGAILDVSTFVRSAYRPPAKVTEAIEAQIADAVVEAARLSLTSPLLGGDAAGQRARKSVKAGSVSVEYETATSADLRAARTALVTAMLRAAGVHAVGSGVNVGLAKS